MNIYTHTKFTGHYPVGVAAVIIAPDRAKAIAKLNDTLRANGLFADAQERDLVPLMIDEVPVCRILNDGNYRK